MSHCKALNISYLFIWERTIPSLGSLPKGTTMANNRSQEGSYKGSQHEPGIQELKPRFPHGWQEPNYLSHHGLRQQEAGVSSWSWESKPRHSKVWHRDLNCLASLSEMPKCPQLCWYLKQPWKQICLHNCLKGTKPCEHLEFRLVRLQQEDPREFQHCKYPAFFAFNSVIINMCRFKPLNMWQLASTATENPVQTARTLTQKQINPSDQTLWVHSHISFPRSNRWESTVMQQREAPHRDLPPLSRKGVCCFKMDLKES